jgi:ubiquitin-protein ligase E3 C
MIGKLVYEKLQCEPRFASFFLRKLLGHVNTLDDLSSLDQQLHRSLMQLRSFTPQQLDDLQQTFSVSRPIYFGSTELSAIPLIPSGLTTPVTSNNLTRYLHLLADYKLNRSLHSQCRAFQSGLQSVIPRDWLQVFTAEELRVLISGEDAMDLADLKANTVYGSGYSVSHEVIGWLWQVVEEMTPSERSALLRFVTSVPRQPLQGFGSLNPKLCVQRVDYTNALALPTSATCMNLLRLPRYQSKEQLKDRLLYAIKNGIGFGLT